MTPTKTDTTPQPFRFCTSLDLTLLTNRRARDLAELLAHVRAVPGSVIYYHTHHFLVQHQYLSPEPPNDFAYWVTHVLQEDRLGEQLAAIDMIQFRTIRALRERLVTVIEGYLNEQRGLRTAPAGEEFHFREAVSFVVPTAHVAHNLAEFADREWLQAGAASPASELVAEKRAEARMKGYVGEACPECGNFTMVRNGTCLKCDTCGSTTGCS